jgi:eukaryotic-like serine/threonine-protein kinase
VSLLGAFVADRLVATIQAPADLESASGKKAVARLRKIGGPSVPKVVAALETADKERSVALSRVLGTLISPKTLPEVVAAMTNANARALQGLVWALSFSKDYNPNKLLDCLTDEAMPRAAVLEILEAQRDRLEPRLMLNRAYQAESTEKAALFRLIAELASEPLLPELISRLSGKDAAAKIHIIDILARFDRPDVRHALEQELSSDNKLVRQAALTAIGRMSGTTDIGQLCQLLRDPDINVQNRAVEVIIKRRHPDTLRHLVEILKDESDFARRAAVEVLNEIGDQDSIKDLLTALKDDDWWVRARATDALARIGGPRVIDAVLGLITDQDESVRRAAVEILNTTKDERAVQHLIEATADPDWWVRERAADALGEIGDLRAVPAVVKMLSGDPRSVPAAIRALAKLAGKDAVLHLKPLLENRDKQIKIAAMAALAEIADPASADTLIKRIARESSSQDPSIAEAATTAVQRLGERMGTGTGTGTLAAAGGGAGAGGEPMLGDGKDWRELLKAAAQFAQTLDITKLEPGDTIEGRYKYIKKIGKGAFGTVLLVEDLVVDERLVLKFLNPGVASDEEMMKRFIHELRYSRKITHRNVIRIYDFIALGGLYAISMEYFPSHPLSDELKDEKPLPLQVAMHYGTDIATGMHVAHQAGIVHRDLKPANVLIDDEGLVKIVDFGVAAARGGDTQLTRTGYVIGSPKYMAPEQILGKKVDEKADIYSLGVILYEMLTGFAPYTRGDHMSVMYQHVQGKAKRAHELNPNVPRELSELVARCMAVDKSKRFTSMEEVHVALAAFSGVES